MWRQTTINDKLYDEKTYLVERYLSQVERYLSHKQLSNSMAEVLRKLYLLMKRISTQKKQK